MKAWVASAALALLLGAVSTNALAQQVSGDMVPSGAPATALISGTITPGDLLIGGPNGTISDSGSVGTKFWSATVDPTVTDGSNEGFSIGSQWRNTTTNVTWTANSVTPGSAVWVAGVNHITISKGFPVPSVAAGATAYVVSGVTGTTVNTQASVSTSVTFGHLHFHAAGAAVGGTFVVTLMTGTLGFETASSVTCTVITGATDCSDVADSVALTEGQAYTLRIVSTSTAISGVGAASLSESY